MALEKLTEDQYYNYPIDEAETTFFDLQNPDKEFLDFYLSKPKDLGFFSTNVSQNPAMVNYGIMGTDQANMFTGDYDDEYVPMPEEKEKQQGGIAKLFQTLLGFAVPGYGLLRNIGSGGLESLRGLNQRIQQSDFGQSKNLMDYLDIRKYGGYQEREDARARTMAQARGIQKKIDRGEFGTRDTSIDRGRGSIPSRTTSSPRKTSPSYSAANRAFAGSR